MSFLRALILTVVAGLVAGVPQAFAQNNEAYFEFLQARRLEADGDAKGALAAAEAPSDPKSR